MHFECPKVGHYGVFNGSRFRSEIATRMGAFLRRADPRTKDLPIALAKPVARLTSNNLADVVDNGDWIGGEEPAFAVTAATAAANVNALELATRLADYSFEVMEHTLPGLPHHSTTMGQPLVATLGGPDGSAAITSPWQMFSMVNSATFDFWSRMGVPTPPEAIIKSTAEQPVAKG